MRLSVPSVGGLVVAAVCIGLVACAGLVQPTLTRDQVQTMLNTELNTGDSAEAIKSFFQRHDFPYTYDASLRRYASSVPPGSRAPLSIYIYTDVDQKLTVTQVIAPPAPQRMERRNPVDDASFLGLMRDRRVP
jgi:hypothetical protein